MFSRKNCLYPANLAVFILYKYLTNVLKYSVFNNNSERMRKYGK